MLYTRYSKDMQFIVEGLLGSKTSFIFLLMLLFLSLIFFSFLLWQIERGNWDANLQCFVREGEKHYNGCSPFQSVPHGLYWRYEMNLMISVRCIVPLRHCNKGADRDDIIISIAIIPEQQLQKDVAIYATVPDVSVVPDVITSSRCGFHNTFLPFSRIFWKKREKSIMKIGK